MKLKIKKKKMRKKHKIWRLLFQIKQYGTEKPKGK